MRIREYSDDSFSRRKKLSFQGTSTSETYQKSLNLDGVKCQTLLANPKKS